MKNVKDSNPGMVGGRDPFADLVRAVEGTSMRTPASAKSYQGFEPVEVPQSAGWDEFTYAPERGAVSERARVALAIEAPMPAPAAARRPAVRGGEGDLQIEDALFGLSQPQRPRDSNPAETQSFAPARQHEPELRQTLTLDDFDELIASEMAAMNAPYVADDEDDYAQGYDESDVEVDRYDDYPVAARSRFRRPAMLLGGVALLALVGVATAAVYHNVDGMSGSDGPLLIKADATPYKVAPADPGGRSIPNQNKAVYQRVAGVGADATPTQQSLVTAMEEPLDIAEDDEPAVDALPGVSVGDEVALPSEQADAGTPAAAPAEPTLQPRKVKTLTVRPDGTLVATEAEAPAGTDLMTTASSSAQVAMLDPVAGIAPQLPYAADADDESLAAAEPEMLPPPAPPVAATAAPAKAATPKAAAPIQVASLEPEPAAGSYFVQIASQPSADLAKQSMSNLGKRYSGAIGGRGLNIKPADIPGKGTFYRVRVVAASKAEANTVCESVKSAGGSCFVTR
ncbi:SPOR domain-containing protein [Aureimonas pseudogalii]|uniref:SPOR domain-containing protein n=1 Tax=Aureimonas pseudogalii TaxID=1744844 RepID=A0A7W6H5X1_9HYPH|nr:SPOR domain-containing protein [Aureimonas pseudogalii]MBB3999124.1 hypothetical protein [Aureimonas pseudogalii]